LLTHASAPLPQLAEIRRARRLARLERRLDAAADALGLGDGDGSDGDADAAAAAAPSDADGPSDADDAFQEAPERFAATASDGEGDGTLRDGDAGGAAAVAARPGGVQFLADELLYAGDDAREPLILGRPTGYWHRRTLLSQLPPVRARWHRAFCVVLTDPISNASRASARPQETQREVLTACFATALSDVELYEVPPVDPDAMAAATAAAAQFAAASSGVAPSDAPPPELPPYGAAALAQPAAATLLRLVADAAAAAGADTTLACLLRALEAWHASPAGRRAPGAREARCSMDVIAAAAADALLALQADALARDAAAAALLAPLDAHLWAPPRAALGRFPQLRAVLSRELDGRSLHDLPFVERRPAEDGVGDGASADGAAWALAFARGSEGVPPLAEERGHWGVRARCGGAQRCRRCATPLAGPRPTRLVAFPCGHVFHAACLPEEACVTCMLANFAPLPAVGAPLWAPPPAAAAPAARGAAVLGGARGKAKGGAPPPPAQPPWVQYAAPQ
jgi:hypothetical protein